MDELPEDVGRFYLPRLAGELVTLVEEMVAASKTGLAVDS